jgi:hypothetical protein
MRGEGERSGRPSPERELSLLPLSEPRSTEREERRRREALAERRRGARARRLQSEGEERDGLEPARDER